MINNIISLPTTVFKILFQFMDLHSVARLECACASDELEEQLRMAIFATQAEVSVVWLRPRVCYSNLLDWLARRGLVYEHVHVFGPCCLWCEQINEDEGFHDQNILDPNQQHYMMKLQICAPRNEFWRLPSVDPNAEHIRRIPFDDVPEHISTLTIYRKAEREEDLYCNQINGFDEDELISTDGSNGYSLDQLEQFRRKVHFPTWVGILNKLNLHGFRFRREGLIMEEAEFLRMRRECWTKSHIHSVVALINSRAKGINEIPLPHNYVRALAMPPTFLELLRSGQGTLESYHNEVIPYLRAQRCNPYLNDILLLPAHYAHGSYTAAANSSDVLGHSDLGRWILFVVRFTAAEITLQCYDPGMQAAGHFDVFHLIEQWLRHVFRVNPIVLAPVPIRIAESLAKLDANRCAPLKQAVDSGVMVCAAMDWLALGLSCNSVCQADMKDYRQRIMSDLMVNHIDDPRNLPFYQ